MSDDINHYAVLGVPADASVGMIREAFAGLLSRFPEGMSAQDDPEYGRILQAYAVLGDPERRAVYDSLLSEVDGAALTVTLQTSQDQLQLSKTAQLVYLLVDILPEKVDSNDGRPLNLSLVIDRSTSMKGARLEQVKMAIDLLIEKLAPDDIISIISFSDRAEVVVPSQTVDNKNALLFKIRNIDASGGTEIFQGLSAGMKELCQVSLSQHTNHLILLTDGHTYGDADQCLDLAQRAAQSGVDCSAFGIGSEWHDQFLDELVAPSGGQSQYIETPTQIIDYLQKRIQGLGNVHARNLRLSLTLPQGITAKFGFKLSPFAQPLALNEQEIKLGNIEGRRPLSFLLELNVAPQNVESRFNIPLNFTADLPHQKHHTFKRQHQIVTLKEAFPSSPSPDIINAVRLLNMVRMNEKVMEDIDAGHLDDAARRMRHLSTRLLEAGQAQLAQQAHLEGERLATMGTLSQEGRKKLKYGTRALLGQTLANLNMGSE